MNHIRKLIRERILPLREFLDDLSVATHESCLDVGAGTGMFLEFLYANKLIRNGVGVEVSDNYCRRINDDLVIKRTDQLSPNETFDLITIVDVLHHVSSNKEAFILNYVENHLKPGGYVFIKDMDNKNALYTFWNRLHDIVFARQFVHELPPQELLRIMEKFTVVRKGAKRIFLYDHYWFVFRKNGA